MERRKFVVGLGALTTGTAAATGTGALSIQESTRDVNVDITSDSDGTLAFSTHPSSLENTQFVETVDGQITLQFNGQGDNKGLNPDSKYHLDNLFQITNTTQDELQITFDKSGLKNSDAFDFYYHGTNGKLRPGGRDNDSGSMGSGGGLNIGVTIETPDSVPEDWETGSVTIVAKNTDDENVDSI
ncbi:MAG: hypothetical protein ACQERM_10665 [Methanobacteriota archaeon]